MTISRTLAPLAICLFGAAFNPALAATISKNAGPTSPLLSDFSAAFAGHPNKVGYAQNTTDGMFIETFKAACQPGQRVVSAKFTIQVRKLTQGPNRGDNDAMAFWQGSSNPPSFNTYLWTTTDGPGTTKTLTFDLGSLPPAGNGVIQSMGNALGTLNDGTFSFSVQDDTAVLGASLVYECGGRVIADGGVVGTQTGTAGGPTVLDSGASARKGMTWGLYPHHPVSGIATVSCQGQPGTDCNAYQGDQMCTVALPVLCMKPSGLPNPASNTQDPQHWSGNIIATTPAVAPAAVPLGTLAQVNAYCAAQFGPGWVVADFHAGTGWKFGAYGNVGNPGQTRFWVNIKDQPAANCWSQ